MVTAVERLAALGVATCSTGRWPARTSRRWLAATRHRRGSPSGTGAGRRCGHGSHLPKASAAHRRASRHRPDGHRRAPPGAGAALGQPPPFGLSRRRLPPPRPAVRRRARRRRGAPALRCRLRDLAGPPRSTLPERRRGPRAERPRGPKPSRSKSPRRCAPRGRSRPGRDRPVADPATIARPANGSGRAAGPRTGARALATEGAVRLSAFGRLPGRVRRAARAARGRVDAPSATTASGERCPPTVESRSPWALPATADWP